MHLNRMYLNRFNGHVDDRQPDRCHHYSTGLKVHAELDQATYHSGIKITDQKLEKVRLRRDKFHGDWNYEILPAKPFK